ncbi:hypothetical protein AURDEDRAFT_131083 [Auricularia subglabra TFB-10046 SS5]|uniref:Uncharacterized protein n=1 Tax=Auricularia subglabra (strain TFB-10046 / SS5) TaxID=717982 RepID=J0D6T8_AURST|nr:hypothetical protein AURDEDRAFT_131083 [Auricularia subglabra TFB-10046 SS5]
MAKYCSEQLRREEERRLASLTARVYDYESDSDPEHGEEDYFDLIRGASPLPEDFFDAPLPPSPVDRHERAPSPSLDSTPGTPSEPELTDDDTFVQDFPGAARVIRKLPVPPLVALFDVHRNSSSLYVPFTSSEEWQFSRWAKTNSITDSALDELLGIQGVQASSYKTARELNKLLDSLPRQVQFRHSVVKVEGYDDEYDLFSCNPLDVLRELVADPTFQGDIVFGAQRCFEGEENPRRMYNQMYASDFAWQTQKALPPGASPLFIIIGSDKTQLTNFSGEHSAYPVYMSIGNIDKSIRNQPSKRAFRLVAFLPTLKPDEAAMSEAKARTLRHRLFHKVMELVFEPLFAAAKDGIPIPDSEGNVRLCFPILASYVADYPEQCLVTGVRYGQTCPKCHITATEFGAHKLGEPRVQEESLRVVDDARAAATAAAEKGQLKDAGLNNIRPFYARWPHADMHRAQSPDCLHQVTQGAGAHLLQWLTMIMGKDELDARLARLPPAHNLRNFARGISGLSRVSGSERKAIYAQILGGIIGRVPREAVRATRALLDFMYIANFECHSDETLASLHTALDNFHKNKAVFQKYNPDLDFNFPKMHMLEHYEPDIRWIGTTDNTNTETTERMHIDNTKNAFRASNRKDFIVQIVDPLNGV